MAVETVRWYVPVEDRTLSTFVYLSEKSRIVCISRISTPASFYSLIELQMEVVNLGYD